jgi:dipeptidyl aminopeptidase/acylaminoacyl peptidase
MDGVRKWLVGALLLAPVAALHAAPALPPIEHFFHNPQFGSAQLSPDGKRVAFLVAAQGGKARLAVLDLQTMKPTVAASYEEADISRFEWVNDQRLVFTQSIDYLWPGLFAVNHDGSGYRQLVNSSWSFFKDPLQTRELLPVGTALLGSASRQNSDEVHVITARQYDKKRGIDYITLQRLNTVTGRAVEVDTPLHAYGWITDPDGALRMVVTRHGDAGAVQLRQADGSWKAVMDFNPRDPGSSHAEPLYISPEGRLYVRAPANGDKAAVYTLDMATLKLSDKPVLASKDFDLRPTFIANDERLLGIRYTIDAEVTHWIDPQMKALQAAIDVLLPDTSNRLSVARRSTTPHVLVEAYSDTEPGRSYVYQTATRKLTLLGRTHPDIKPAAMGLMDMVRYKARDGLEIPAYLTLPRGSEAAAQKNLPLVVLVHGGPMARGASWGWNPEVQFLASRGYAVLQPEFRGGTGFGAQHYKAGWKQWGLAMQNDLADGARWAIAQGIADPKRICIAGASYGGYAAMMGLVNDADLFRCAVNWVGVTDINLLFDVSWSDITEEFKRYGMALLVGDQAKDAAQFKATSPLQQAARITQPVLMAYGEWDQRVPQVHGEKMRDALKPHNPNVEWVVYEKEGHGWSKVETRLDFWGRVEKFLARNLAPR